MRISIEAFDDRAFMDEWNALALTSPSGVFATPDWHEAVQAAYAGRGRSLVCSLRVGSKLIGIAPLRLSSTGLVLRSASLLGMGEGGYGLADYGGLVVAPGHEAEVASGLLAWMRKLSWWDIIDLQQLPAGALTSALVNTVEQDGMRALVRKHNSCHVIDLPGTWQEYRSRLSQSTRDWLERKPRKAERELGATVELVERDWLVDEYLNMRRFQAARFGEPPRERERKLGIVISDWLMRAHDRGWLRMFRLKNQSGTLGVLLGYEYRGTFYFHSAAFDEKLSAARYSLGSSLLAAALRWSIDHGLQRFDMLRGHYDYKERLGSRLQYNYRILVFRGSPVGTALAHAMKLRGAIKGGRAWRSLRSSEGKGEAASAAGSESPAEPAHQIAGAPVGVE